MLLGLSGAGCARERALMGRHPGLGPHTPSVQGELQEGENFPCPALGGGGRRGNRCPSWEL